MLEPDCGQYHMSMLKVDVLRRRVPPDPATAGRAGQPRLSNTGVYGYVQGVLSEQHTLSCMVKVGQHLTRACRWLRNHLLLMEAWSWRQIVSLEPGETFRPQAAEFLPKTQYV
jgi:hypothetical protein